MVDRERVMGMARIRGVTTYYRVMRELGDWGFVEYRPSKSWKKGNWVRVTHRDPYLRVI
jgi:hypothetical protein